MALLTTQPSEKRQQHQQQQLEQQHTGSRQMHSSMALPAKKRKIAWPQESAPAAAERDAYSNSVPNSVQDSKRTRTEDLSTTSASVFGMSTGRLEDRFALSDAVLGAGQFGSVRPCTDRFTGETLACKTLRKDTLAAEVQRDEVRNEVAIMMRTAGHDNVVQLRGVFEEEEAVHLVMELCDGGELFDEVLRRQRFTERDAALIFSEIVSAVAFCHSKRVIHRDLKPENILLSRRKEAASSDPPIKAKLADFGLSTFVAPGHQVKGVVGSPFYMAPEVLTGEYNTKADVWSLGVILYILLTGSPPFWGDKDEDVFDAILSGEVDFTSYPWPTISPEAKNLIRCLLIRDPASRPSAQKIFTHPWMLRHCAAGTAPARRKTGPASLAPLPVRVV